MSEDVVIVAPGNEHIFIFDGTSVNTTIEGFSPLIHSIDLTWFGLRRSQVQIDPTTNSITFAAIILTLPLVDFDTFDRASLVGLGDDFSGTELDETINGTDFNDEIHAGGGDDIVRGRAGDDLIYGDEGNDRLFADAGNDTVYGGIGNDKVYGGDGNDSLRGDEGDDTVRGGDGNDTLHGEAGKDKLYGGDGRDILYGGDGDDIVHGGDGADDLYGGAGADKLYGGDGFDWIIGGEGEDRLYGGNDTDFIFAENGDDRAYGGAGNDFVYGEEGNDLVRGGDGDDRLQGDAGDDRLRGDNGNDLLFGGNGSDKLYGNDGNDLLYGNSGADKLYGGNGDDVLYAIDGTVSTNLTDLTLAEDYSATVDFKYSRGVDQSSLGVYKIAQDGTIYDVDIVFASASGSGVADPDIPGGSSYTLDVLSGERLGFFIVGNAWKLGEENQTNLTMEGAQYELRNLQGEVGNVDNNEPTQLWRVGETPADDVLILSSLDSQTYHSVATAESGYSSNGDNVQHTKSTADLAGGEIEIAFEDSPGGGDNDFNDVVITVEIGQKNLLTLPGLFWNGDEQDTHVLQGGAGDDVLIGASGNDLLFGGLDDDVLNAGAGDDVLRGDGGSDLMLGGDGKDIFLFKMGQQAALGVEATDTIADFVRGEDVLKFTKTGNNIEFSDVQIDGNTISVGDYIHIKLGEGIASQLTADDFLFV